MNDDITDRDSTWMKSPALPWRLAFRQMITSGLMLIMIVVSQLPTLTMPSGIGFDTCKTDDDIPSDRVFAEFCSKFFPLVLRYDLFYKICLINSFTLLHSINEFTSSVESEKCSNSVSPFISNGTHLFCGNGNYNIVVGLQEKSVQINDIYCTFEWKTIEFGFDIQTPAGYSIVSTGENETTFLNCPDDFDVYCDSFCLPSCKRSSQTHWGNDIVFNNVTIALIIISLLAGISACTFKGQKMVKKHFVEHKKWQKKSQKQFNEITTLPQKMEQKLVKTKSNLQHQLLQNHQHNIPSIQTQADRCTKESSLPIEKLQGSAEIHKDKLIHTNGKALMSQISVEQLSMKQPLVEDETEDVNQNENQQIKMRDEVLAMQNIRKQTSSTNSRRDIIQEGTTKRSRHNHTSQIIQKNCKEECDREIQNLKEMYIPQVSSKQDTITIKIARTYDDERVYRMYINSITKWRKEASLKFEPPQQKFGAKMRVVAKEIEKKVFINNKSPEEEVCKNAVKNCLHNRDQLISQLNMQLCKS